MPPTTKKFNESTLDDLTTDQVNYSKTLLRLTNKYRKDHGCQELKYSEKLTKMAVRRARYLCAKKHRDYEHYRCGEIVREGISGRNDTPVTKAIVDDWYAQKKHFDFNLHTPSEGAVCFTQMIWKASKEFGAAIFSLNLHRNQVKYVVVAIFEPIGNNRNFKANVPDLIREETMKDGQVHPEEEDDDDQEENIYFNSQLLTAHNRFRRAHGCPPLHLDDSLTAKAKNRVSEYFAGKELVKKKEFGYNTYEGEMPLPIHGDTLAKVWYDEMAKYDFNAEQQEKPQKTQHFTQMIWKSTTKIGIAYERRERRGKVICLYTPPGNIAGEYSKNVPKFGTLDRDRLEKEIFEEHNHIRKEHHAPPLEWDKGDLKEKAQSWADRLAREHKIEHEPEESNYQNIAYIAHMENVTGARIVKEWYKQASNYDYEAKSHNSSTGYFTAMVWVATKRIGIGIAKAEETIYVVCDYDPHGNADEEFTENVRSKSWKPSDSVKPVEAAMAETRTKSETALRSEVTA